MTDLANPASEFAKSVAFLTKSVVKIANSMTFLTKSATEIAKPVADLAKSVIEITNSMIFLTKSVVGFTKSVIDLIRSELGFVSFETENVQKRPVSGHLTTIGVKRRNLTADAQG